MKSLVIALPLLALWLALVPVRPAAADPFARHAQPYAGAATASLVVPAEWAGVWTVTDSVYTCAGVSMLFSSMTDTLCTGQVFGDPTLDCTGTFDASSYTQHCTGSSPVSADCVQDFVIDSHGTRTADSYFGVSTITITYVGTGCGGLPPQCTQVNSHGNRTGPAPADYCATPTREESWGSLKAHYR